MKNVLKIVFATIIVVFALADISIAQAPGKGTKKIPIAVIEFTPGPNVSAVSAEAKRQLQSSTAYALAKSHHFDVADVRNTIHFSKSDLPAINGPKTAAAVKVGKQLRVNYVLTGIIEEFNTEGSAILKTRLVEVSTGKVLYEEATSQKCTKPMVTGSDMEMKTFVLKPLIDQITADLLELKL